MGAKRKAAAPKSPAAKKAKAAEPTEEEIRQAHFDNVEKGILTFNQFQENEVNIVNVGARISLGVYRSDRTEKHHQAIKWVQDSLARYAVQLADSKKACADTLGKADAEKADKTKIKESKEAVLATAEEAYSEAKKEQAARAAELKAKTKEMSVQAKQLQAAERSVEVAERKAADIQEASARVAEIMSSAEAPPAKMRNALMAFLKTSPIDKTMLTAAQGAMASAGSGRTQFQTDTLKALGQFVSTQAEAAAKEIASEKEKCRDVEQTMLPLVEAKQSLEKAQAKVAAVKKQLDDAVAAKKDAAAALQAVVDEAEQAQQDFDGNADLVKTMEEVRHSFEALRDAIHPELALAISCVDHTTLNDTDTPASVAAICEAAAAAPDAAAVCIFPQFVKEAREKFPSLKIATVTNFPLGTADPAEVAASSAKAIEDGANEIDVVIDYKLVLKDREAGIEAVTKLVTAVRDAVPFGLVKVILETGELKEADLIKAASDAALAAGADFIKTSTGKVPVNCTPEAAKVMLQSIVAHRRKTGKTAGFKAAGGVRTFEQAREYFELARSVLGAKHRISPVNFRFGSSSLLPALRKAAGVASGGAPVASGY
mmetsp:Transcript_2525/g.5847  ORF Transcript_2525/g.5847 Transcript_2525/m.5847 type:complete len:600 (-) Transcript_2525:166-1965(-)